jgi:hypothetical protein
MESDPKPEKSFEEQIMESIYNDILVVAKREGIVAQITNIDELKPDLRTIAGELVKKGITIINTEAGEINLEGIFKKIE